MPPPHCCSGCWDELHQERIIQKAEARRMDVCSAGPMPVINHDSEDSEDTDLEEIPVSVEEGD